VLGGLADSVLKLFTGVLQAAISALTGFAATMIPFVEKISPATVQNYQTQLNNLIATIGVAFQGFVATAADLIQRTAGVILPLAEELAPIFSQLADIVRSGLLPIIKVWVALFASIATVLGSAMGGLRDIVIQTVRAFVILAASVARLLGATDFLERLREAINRPEGGGAIAAQPATITNFEEIGRSLAAAAATASVSASGAEAEAGPRVEDLLGDILEQIEVITPEAVAELVGETFTELWENTVEPRLVEMGQQIEAWWASDGQQQFRAILVSIIDEIWNAFARWLQNQAWFRNLMPGNGPIPTSQELRNASASILLNPGQAVVDSALYWFSPGN
jgi:hypothetical protein